MNFRDRLRKLINLISLSNIYFKRSLYEYTKFI